MKIDNSCQYFTEIFYISKRILNNLGRELTSPDENYIMSIDLGVCIIKLSTDAEEMHCAFLSHRLFVH